MGRMADIWKTTERGPLTPLPVPGALLTLENAVAAQLTDDDDIPFIEVGGPRPVMKHLEPIAPKAPIDGQRPDASKKTPARLPNGEVHRAIAPTIMTVTFEAVRGSLVSGRGFGPELIAFHQPDHAVSVQYRSLMAEIVTQLPGAKPRVMLLVAAKPSVGATTVAINLGVTIARQESTRAILVDANFAQPDLAGRLGLSATPGLRDVIARQNPLSWSMQETMQTNLSALTAGRDDAPPAADLVPIVEQLRSRNDWIILDAGPWDERLVPLAEACDAVYLVHAENDAGSKELIGSILAATGRLRGCVITRR
jgi:Mrp family chromosome partitioning ATPase